MGPIRRPETSGIKYNLGKQIPLNMGQIALFRNIGDKLPLKPKIQMQLTDNLSPIISKILPLSANITSSCER